MEPLILLHPTYFPTIATMAVVSRRKCLWEVCDYYQKQTFRNRTYICTDQGKHMLSIPIQHVGGAQGKQYYKDVKVDNQYPWQRQHWRTLQTAYRASPFFEYYEDELAPIYHDRFTYLLDFNFRSIELACEFLQLGISLSKTSTFDPCPSDITDMRFMVNAKKSLPFTPTSYTQVFMERHGFLGNLSILDLLFNEGTAATAYLQELSLSFTDA
ncbi:WbqC family protein [Muriicola sp.]|uniref:WbqC family protein n=1 Tax=Muriicola sp. TaxID=2020856 RepID=UPI003C778AE1